MCPCQKEASTAPGAWVQLRDALDYADATRFPVAQFGGPVEQDNLARLKKIAAHFVPMGARLQDPTAASASRHKSRDRFGINNAGWRIWPHNYGKWMQQINPSQTSVGRWCVGKETALLGQNTRQTVPGKNISFALAPGLFANHSSALHVRVAYFDEGSGSWELNYAAASGGMQRATKVAKTNTLEFIEVRLNLTDLDLALDRNGGAEAHLTLVDSDAKPAAGGDWATADPDTFAFVEVLKTPFLFPMAEVVHGA